MPIFFITSDQVRNGTATITGPLLHHLRTSLRTRIGQTLWVGDDRRRRHLIRVTHLDQRHLVGQVLKEQDGPMPRSPAITVGQALLKSDRMDWVIQKATELGAASFIPLMGRYVIIRPKPARVVTQQQRWQRIALEAAQQAERWEIPTLVAPCEAAEFFAKQPPADVNLILTERGYGESLASIPLPSSPESTIVIATGPEGGWAKEELTTALQHGFTPVTLGKRILRAETAVLAALSILQSRIGELG
ncbi:MAG TPA: RsmE family RNA methyltransferase [Nitrospiraceae bacterium]|nr:RsmE family RNA methyltransferase [Nitrospiraceae bacterium]